MRFVDALIVRECCCFDFGVGEVHGDEFAECRGGGSLARFAAGVGDELRECDLRVAFRTAKRAAHVPLLIGERVATGVDTHLPHVAFALS